MHDATSMTASRAGCGASAHPSLLRRLIDVVRRRRVRRRQMMDVAHLNDLMLADIGLTRDVRHSEPDLLRRLP
jgi:uncharacterized protein YjiS (DUF1127 family)